MPVRCETGRDLLSFFLRAVVVFCSTFAAFQNESLAETVIVPQKDANGNIVYVLEACSGTCQQLTHAQVAQVAFSGGSDWAGFRGGSLVNAVAIAEAESTHFLNAIHYGSNGTIDRGLWQINSIHGYDANRLLSDASYNARAAYRIADAANDVDWTPWAAYLSGSFVQFLGPARVAAQTIDATVIRASSNRVVADANLTTRSTAGGSVVGQVSRGARGTVTSGPVVAKLGGYHFVWWRIDWDGSSADGWSIEDDMSRTPGALPPNDVLVDFGGNGLWQRMNNATWVKIDTRSPIAITAGDLDNNFKDEAIASFTGYGLQARYNNGGAWRLLHSSAPNRVQAGDLDGNGVDDIAGDFGTLGLLTRVNNSAWSRRNSGATQGLWVGDLDGNSKNELIVDRSSGLFVLYNNVAWTQLATVSPVRLATGDLDGNGKDELIVDRGSTGLWVRFNNVDPWKQISPSTSQSLRTGDLDGNGKDELIVDRGGAGLWVRYANSAWVRLSTASPNRVVTVDLDRTGKDDIVAGFSSGLLARLNNGGSWVRLHNWTEQSLAVGGFD